MYQPPYFNETRLEVLHALIRAHPLGLLISNGADGPVADPGWSKFQEKCVTVFRPKSRKNKEL